MTARLNAPGRVWAVGGRATPALCTKPRGYSPPHFRYSRAFLHAGNARPFCVVVSI